MNRREDYDLLFGIFALQVGHEAVDASGKCGFIEYRGAFLPFFNSAVDIDLFNRLVEKCSDRTR